ncbi:T9SS type B sorting domain-containing protein [uncultured Psychroserpens sp.]|uniref:T9SS type B sorting domain-containing protein n=1 Tax=uncultured Psychroserpens sp. TaxID=255436 RepID=UPI002619E8A3|nr:T9SS type B sorting domain-containing protein [uncultured Psychroserpens sp.]
MRNTILLLSFMLVSSILFSQNEAANWYFGFNAGVTFNSGSPVTMLDGELNTTEGCATISNSAGQLLFYTDGITVWDKNHNIMPNGTGLLGDPSSTQSAIVVPKPGNIDIYYIFTVDEQAGPNGLRYSELDLALNSGNGDITTNKNILLTTPTTEKISAVAHANGTDFWVVTHEFNNADFLAYEITAAGVNATPVVSTSGSPHSGSNQSTIGNLKFSPSGEKLALAKSFSPNFVELFDFDANTGVISNPITISGVFYNTSEGPYGIEFSSDSNVLYVSDIGSGPSRIHQFDISLGNQTDIINSDFVLFQGNGVLGSLQLAIDEKIYVANYATNFLDVIENPNTLGATTMYTDNGVDLMGRQCRLGLPPFIQSFFNVGIQINDTCFGDETQFSVNSSEAIVSIDWDFGDMTTSTDESPTHIYASTGTYTVNVTVTTLENTATLSREVTVYEVPLANQPSDYILCDDVSNDETEIFDLSTKVDEVLGMQSATLFDVLFFETAEDANNNENVLPLSYSNISNSQEVFVRIHNSQNTACYDITSFNLIVNLQPIANAVDDLILCDDEVNDGLEEVNLTMFDSTVIGNQDDTAVTVTYYLTQNDADNAANQLPINYETVTNPQTIFVRIESNTNPDCFDTNAITITVDEQLLAFQPQDMNTCDDDSNDGFEFFNLSSQDDQISNGQTGTFEITYHISEEDANLNQNALPTNYENTSNPQTIFARIENTTNTNCFNTTSFEVNVLGTPDIETDETFYLCTGETIELVADAGLYYYDWSTGETTSSIDVDQAGTYTVDISQEYPTDPVLRCSKTKTFTVIESNAAEITSIEIDDWSQNNNMITVFVEGLGDYEYSIDGIVYQDSNVFDGLSPGDYTVYVRDRNDCGIVTEDVYLLYYPKFFTPNGDTYNAYWQIIFSEIEPDLQILIFDRFGKLIKELDPVSAGWDGTYKGQNMPASDYWFVVNRPSNGKTYRGHFALVR